MQDLYTEFYKMLVEDIEDLHKWRKYWVHGLGDNMSVLPKWTTDVIQFQSESQQDFLLI